MKIILAIFIMFLSACNAPPQLVAILPSQNAPTEWVMEWYCNANKLCIYDMGQTWGRDFVFPNQHQCTDWEKEFLTMFPGASCTPCTKDN